MNSQVLFGHSEKAKVKAGNHSGRNGWWARWHGGEFICKEASRRVSSQKEEILSVDKLLSMEESEELKKPASIVSAALQVEERRYKQELMSKISRLNGSKPVVPFQDPEKNEMSKE
ncbi:hypothetical protein BHYA_0315g00080 [Botrytis hyacinthi]|uniref:Uncharacterized protein n=1 Tax=Botrytis hyacinthi TaxID=278943 RepID=A0A4Z1GEZ7_9HELO|nr:hypothetical protein BHYA_0315g00080 [Botrytis hyacinthi]